MPCPAVHRTIVLVDIVGFSEPYRTHRDQLAVRTGLYRALERAFQQAGILWGECHREDRGDGVLVLAPPHMPKEYFATRLPRALAIEVTDHNARHAAAARIRVRMALHAGEITYDANGVSSPALVHAFRLIDAPTFKKEMAAAPEPVGIVMSAWYFDEVVQQLHTEFVEKFHRAVVHVKSTIAVAWITMVRAELPRSSRLVGLVEPQAFQATGRVSVTRERGGTGRHRLDRQASRGRFFTAFVANLFVRSRNNEGETRIPSPAGVAHLDDETARIPHRSFRSLRVADGTSDHLL